jgi:ribosome-associated toxin RatA of RatAB toxin-antitoxin module
MKSVISVEVAASPDLLFRLAHDVERWPSLLPHYISVRADSRVEGGAVLARFVAVRPLVLRLGLGLPVAWRAITWNEPDERRLRFRHVGGPTSGMDVTWRIEPAGSGSNVSIDHDFRPRFALFAPFVDRCFTRPIAGRTLATFKAIAEALATDATGSTGQSDTLDPTNPQA